MHSACLNYYFFLLIWIIIKRTVKEDFSLKKKPCSLLCLLEWFLKRSLFSKKKCQFHFLNRYFPPTLAAHLLIPTKFVAAISISLYRKHPHFSCTAWKKKILLLGLFIVAPLVMFSFPSPSVTSSRYCMIHSIFPIFLFFFLCQRGRNTLWKTIHDSGNHFEK